MSDTVAAAMIAGLVALIVAALSNFGAEAYKRHKETTTIAAGLAGELAVYMDALPIILASWGHLQRRAAEGELLIVPKVPMPTNPVFDSCVSKLGMLGAEVAEEVAYVYTTVHAFRGLMANVHEDGTTAERQAAAIAGALWAAQRAHDRGKALLPKLRRIAKAEFLEIQT